MNMKKILLLLCVSVLSLPAATPARQPAWITQFNSQLQPAAVLAYRTVGDLELKLNLFKPAAWKASDKRPCLFLIHGGGWTGGNPTSLFAYADWAAQHGMVGISISYRLHKKPYGPDSPVPVFECVRDVRSAIRYVREHAAELGIDPSKITASGASAGGHLAAALALFDYNNPSDNLKTPAMPDALILMSPVADTSAKGYGQAKIGADWKKLSPCDNIRPGLPPTHLCHGDADKTTPVLGADKFAEAMRKAGNRCDYIRQPGGIHVYMSKDAALHQKFLSEVTAFLQSLGYIRQ
jgi:acetyl esterase/lipase